MKGPEKRISVLILSRRAIFRDGLKLLLEAEAGFSVVGVTGDRDLAVKLSIELKPDILLFDICDLPLPSADSDSQVLRQIALNAGSVRTILLTASGEEAPIIEALRFGARGVVRKDAGVPMLFKCIRSVHDGVYWISHNTTCELIKSLESLQSRLEQSSKLLNCRLSERELQVIKEVVMGNSNKDIAQTLSISEQAVKYHLTNIFGKIGLSGRMELARFAIRHQLVREA